MLVASDISVGRGGRALIEGLSFTLSAGELIILRGDNGVGKTTLLRTLAGLNDPMSGTVSAKDESLTYAGHLDGIKANLTVQENLKFWADVFQTDSIETALTSFDLTDLRDRPAHAMSAGQKRRLGLARLLVTGRDVWILDEPTVSLDRATVQKFGGIVGAHLARGGAAIIATHVDIGIDGRVIDLNDYVAAPVSQASSFDEGFL